MTNFRFLFIVARFGGIQLFFRFPAQRFVAVSVPKEQVPFQIFAIARLVSPRNKIFLRKCQDSLLFIGRGHLQLVSAALSSLPVSRARASRAFSASDAWLVLLERLLF